MSKKGAGGQIKSELDVALGSYFGDPCFKGPCNCYLVCNTDPSPEDLNPKEKYVSHHLCKRLWLQWDLHILCRCRF